MGASYCQCNWRWRQSSANLSLFRVSLLCGKYREILALEAGYGEAALALANKFKSFPTSPNCRNCCERLDDATCSPPFVVALTMTR